MDWNSLFSWSLKEIYHADKWPLHLKDILFFTNLSANRLCMPYGCSLSFISVSCSGCDPQNLQNAAIKLFTLLCLRIRRLMWWCAGWFLSAWHRPRGFGEEDLQSRKYLRQIACRQVCRVFSWLMISVGGSSPLWVVSLLGRLPLKGSLTDPSMANMTLAGLALLPSLFLVNRLHP